MSEPTSPSKTMNEEDNLPRALAALSEDLDRCRKYLDAEDNQFWRRTLFRTTFAMMEAMNNTLREKALEAACGGGKTSFNATRIGFLGEYTFRIDETGRLKEEFLRLPFLNYTAFLLRSLAEESNVQATFFSKHGWDDLRKSVQVRHRLTHPKTDTDMTISNEEIEKLNSAVEWYSEAVHEGLSNRQFWKSEGDQS